MGKAKKSIYKRIVLKLSGEAFQGKTGFGIDEKALLSIAQEIKEVKSLNLGVAVVVGGGNLYRGKIASSSEGIDRSTADYIGMLATVINGLALQDALEKKGVPARLQTAIQMEAIAEPYIRRKAMGDLKKGRVVVFAGGTGNPYFTTDTAAALRAMEISADVILKATKVDGVYSSDPLKDRGAKRFERLRFIDVLNKGIKVMDATAISLCMNNNLPIVIFNLFKKGNIRRVLLGEEIGTVIGDF